MRKVVIALEDVQAHTRFRRRVNRPLLSSLVFTLRGKPVPIDKEAVDEFMLTGLSNIDFVASGFYKKGKLRR